MPSFRRNVVLLAMTAFHGSLGSDLGAQASELPLPNLVVPAAKFDRGKLSVPSGPSRIRTAGNLAAGGCCVYGWVEYDFEIGATGWYQLFSHGGAKGVEFIVDPPRQPGGPAALHVVGGSGYNETRDKIANVWLSAGPHRLRLQRQFWTGFPPISAIEFRKSGNSLAESTAHRLPEGSRVFRINACPALEIATGGRDQPARLTYSVKDPYSHATRSGGELAIPASNGPLRQKLALPCAEEGHYWLSFGEYVNGRHAAIDNRGIRGMAYEVIDTRGPVRSSGKSRASATAPVIEIDCSSRNPDYSGGETRVVRSALGAYRESGEHGWTLWQRTPAAARRLMPEPSWFAYRLDGLEPQQRYRIDIDYPDDAWRTFGAALRESAPLAYPVAVGVDTGGEFPLSNQMQTMSMTVWPRGVSPRLTFMTAHDGSRAACARIRVQRLDVTEPLAVTPGTGRRFLNYHEEGANYLSLFGPPDTSPRGQLAAAERWAEGATAVGAGTLMPTVVVYDFALYPSAFNRAFSDNDDDPLRRLLLVAEKYGLEVVPELHPRGDDMLFGRSDTTVAPDNLLLSREGKSRFLDRNGRRIHPPYYHPLQPEYRDWYVGMIGELAERYRDSPALTAISLRYMAWANPALNNFVSLDWGYDDYTIDLFRKETGVAVPTAGESDPGRFAARYEWLTTHARDRWIDWRCRKITDLVVQIRNRVRQARPDLRIVINVFGADESYRPDFASAPGRSLQSRLREAGLDPAMLGNIDGVEVLNASFGYGRRERDAIFRGSRDTLLDPSSIRALARGSGAHFLAGQYYLEATDAVISPEQLGFPAGTKRTWAGIVANPPGRLALERYALQLAEADALTLGDGGNGYSLGPPIVREFMETFRRLPARPFASLPDATDPVAVRSLATEDGLIVYAVNRERYPVELDIALENAAGVTTLADGKAAPIDNGHLRLKLRPYELIAFKAAALTRIRTVATRVPDGERERVARQIAAVERLAGSSLVQTLVRRGPSDQETRLLNDAALEARRALDRGWLWRARTVLEHSALLAIYKRTGCFPPDLLDGDREARSCPE